MKNRIVVVVVLLVAVFLVGFVPQYAKAKRLEGELRAARQQLDLGQLRDLVGLAYVQASQKNYGLAADACTNFFNRTREVADQTADASSRKALEDLLAARDKVTAGLAKGDPGVLSDLQTLFVKTRQATNR